MEKWVNCKHCGYEEYDPQKIIELVESKKCPNCKLKRLETNNQKEREWDAFWDSIEEEE